jgi:16S rRNA (uracil1498-N3)-methyltransferase
VTLAEWPRRQAALAQLRVPDPAGPTLSRADEHHLRTVLRAREGEEVVVTDGAGAWAFARVAPGGLERVGEVAHDPAPADTALYLPALKGERAEWAIAKATELGVARVVALNTRRASVRLQGDARERVLARWRRVAAVAAGQCRRTHDLVVEGPVAPADVPADVGVAQSGGSADWRGVRAVAVGPEGGWEPGEWTSERRLLSLGPTVLRAETAAVVAAALVAFGAGGWGLTLGPEPMGNDEGTR